eukprot:tig00001527_g9252.t1
MSSASFAASCIALERSLHASPYVWRRPPLAEARSLRSVDKFHNRSLDFGLALPHRRWDRCIRFKVVAAQDPGGPSASASSCPPLDALRALLARVFGRKGPAARSSAAVLGPGSALERRLRELEAEIAQAGEAGASFEFAPAHEPPQYPGLCFIMAANVAAFAADRLLRGLSCAAGRAPGPPGPPAPGRRGGAGPRRRRPAPRPPALPAGPPARPPDAAQAVEEEGGWQLLTAAYLVCGRGGAGGRPRPPGPYASVGASGAAFGLFTAALLLKARWGLWPALEGLVLGQFVLQQVGQEAVFVLANGRGRFSAGSRQSLPGFGRQLSRNLRMSYEHRQAASAGYYQPPQPPPLGPYDYQNGQYSTPSYGYSARQSSEDYQLPAVSVTWDQRGGHPAAQQPYQPYPSQQQQRGSAQANQEAASPADLSWEAGDGYGGGGYGYGGGTAAYWQQQKPGQKPPPPPGPPPGPPPAPVAGPSWEAGRQLPSGVWDAQAPAPRPTARPPRAPPTGPPTGPPHSHTPPPPGGNPYSYSQGGQGHAPGYGRLSRRLSASYDGSRTASNEDLTSPLSTERSSASASAAPAASIHGLRGLLRVELLRGRGFQACRCAKVMLKVGDEEVETPRRSTDDAGEFEWDQEHTFAVVEDTDSKVYVRVSDGESKKRLGHLKMDYVAMARRSPPTVDAWIKIPESFERMSVEAGSLHFHIEFIAHPNPTAALAAGPHRAARGGRRGDFLSDILSVFSLSRKSSSSSAR